MKKFSILVLAAILAFIMIVNIARAETVMLFTGGDLTFDKRARIKSTGEPYTGTAVSYFDNGQLKKKQIYVDGLPYGISEGYYPNGQIESKGHYKGAYWDGNFWMVMPIEDGTWEFYYENGQLSRIENYDNGQPQGIWEAYYENGQLESKGKMYPYWDMKDGVWKYYDSNGSLINTDIYVEGKFQAEGNYKDGNRHGLWEFVEYGLGCNHDYFKGTYKNGVKHGGWITGPHEMYGCATKEYELRDHMNYLEGELHGSWKTILSILDESILYVDGNYENGLKVGEWKYFNEEGQLDYTENYKNGLLIEN